MIRIYYENLSDVNASNWTDADWTQIPDIAGGSVTKSATSVDCLRFRIYKGNAYYGVISNLRVLVKAVDDTLGRVFTGRVLTKKAGFDIDGTQYLDVTCEGCEAFLMDSFVRLDTDGEYHNAAKYDETPISNGKKWWDGQSNGYFACDLMSDGTRRVKAVAAVMVALDAHNYHVDSAKRIYIGSNDFSDTDYVYLSAGYDRTAKDIIDAVRDQYGKQYRIAYNDTGDTAGKLFIQFSSDFSGGSSSGTMNLDNTTAASNAVDMGNVVTRLYCYGDTYQKNVETALNAGLADTPFSTKHYFNNSELVNDTTTTTVYPTIYRWDVGNLGVTKVHVVNTGGWATGCDVACVGNSSTEIDTFISYADRKNDFWLDVSGGRYLYMQPIDKSLCTVYGYSCGKTYAGIPVDNDHRLTLGWFIEMGGQDSDGDYTLLKYLRNKGFTVTQDSDNVYRHIDKNTSTYGVIEGCVELTGLVDTSPLQDSGTAFATLPQFTDALNAANSASLKATCRKFVKYVASWFEENCDAVPTVTVSPYDLAQLGISGNGMKLYDRWNVSLSSTIGYSGTLIINEITYDLSEPYAPTITLGRRGRKSSQLNSATLAKGTENALNFASTVKGSTALYFTRESEKTTTKSTSRSRTKSSATSTSSDSSTAAVKKWVSSNFVNKNAMSALTKKRDVSAEIDSFDFVSKYPLLSLRVEKSYGNMSVKMPSDCDSMSISVEDSDGDVIGELWMQSNGDVNIHASNEFTTSNSDSPLPTRVLTEDDTEGLFTIKKVTIPFTASSIAARGSQQKNTTFTSPSGYTPVGVVGHYSYNHTWLTFTRAALNYSNRNQVDVTAVNVSNSAQTPSATGSFVWVLFAKTGVVTVSS